MRILGSFERRNEKRWAEMSKEFEENFRKMRLGPQLIPNLDHLLKNVNFKNFIKQEIYRNFRPPKNINNLERNQYIIQEDLTSEN